VAHDDGTFGLTISVVGPAVDSRLIQPTLDRGRWLTARDSMVAVVSRSVLAGEPALHVGGDVALLAAGQRHVARIVGVVEAGPTPAIYMRREIVAGLIGGGVDRLALLGAQRDTLAVQRMVAAMRPTLATAGFAVEKAELVSIERQVIEDHLRMVVRFLGVAA